MMDIKFTESAHQDYLYWEQNDSKKFERIKKLCKAVLKDPFKGIGKPEPLKYDLQGCWSRRIDKTHRLVYKKKDKEIIIISCRYHY